MLKFVRLVGTLLGLLMLSITTLLALVPGDRTPPSAWIVFVSDRDGNQEIYRMRPDGSEQQRLTGNYPFIWINEPEWSPDGQWIAFAAHSQQEGVAIYRINVDGTGLQRLTTDGGSYPQWSPDGQWITFEYAQDTGYQIYRMRPNGTQQQNLSNMPRHAVSAQWSPDSQWIVFVAERADTMGYAVYRMRADGTQRQLLRTTRGGNTDPQWSPDGQWIAFVSFRKDKLGLYRMRADGTQVRLIIPLSSRFEQFQWSPDGQWLVIASDRMIFRVGIHGLEQRLTTNRSWNHDPQWSLNGEWIMFASSLDSEICLMRPDGSDKHPVTADPARDEYAEWSPPLKRSWHPWIIIAASIGLVGANLIPWRKLSRN